MASYQDIDIRLKVIEDKVGFMMKVSQVTLQVGSPLDATPQLLKLTMEEFYKEMQRQGGMIINADKELGQGLVGDNGADALGQSESEERVDKDGNPLPSDFSVKRIPDDTELSTSDPLSTSPASPSI